MKNKREIVDNMLVYHDGRMSTHAAVVYSEDFVELVKEGRKTIECLNHRFVKGPTIQAYMIANPERQAIFVSLVRAAKTINDAIIALCVAEMEKQEKRSQKKGKR